MQFITLDQRIAVENFEVGIIYTVTFINGDNFTGSCIGIGVDFVAFQRTAPELLFCLTMATAANVASIEPLGNDIGNIIEYTGNVPVSIKTDGSPLLDYLFTGNTVQNGTPTPSAPVAVVGVGELDNEQYKIPILSAGQTTPVYLGEVETTRKIRKLVLTGKENWSNVGGQAPFQYLPSNFAMLSQDVTFYICSHYKGIPYSASWSANDKFVSASAQGLRFKDTTFNPNLDDFKAYLAAQYAAGTPVTVWYVLATEETTVVNEPLMRIGDYADTLSYRQSGVNVPTIDGLNIFDINTTVKPSEVYLKYFSPLF